MLRSVLAIACVTALFGCSEIRKPIDISQPTSLGVSLKYEYKNKHSKDNYLKIYEASNEPKKERNQIIFELMGLVDDDYNHFERAVRADRAYKDSIVKIVSLIFTGAASLSEKTAANTLAALDTGLKGANEAVDSNAFRSYAPELIANRMRANRAKIATHIFEMLGRSEKEYLLQEAIRDVIQYYNEGTISSALASLAASTAEEASKAMDAARAQKLKLKN